MKLFRVTQIVNDKTLESFYVADHISQIIEKLEVDLKDESTEITGIDSLVPILGILCASKPATE